MALKPGDGEMGQKKNAVDSLGAAKLPRKKTALVFVMSAKGGKKDRIFKFDKDRIVIGSVVSADIRLVGDGISPIHAVVERNEDSATGQTTAMVFDLASETGVFINSKKIVAQALTNQDRVTIGRDDLVFSLESFDPVVVRERNRQTEGRTLFLNPNEDLTPLLLEDERRVEEIFDFRPTTKKALEAVMSWFGTILAIEHFVREKSVTVGSHSESDFGIPPILSSPRFPIMTRDHSGFVLNFDLQMSGVVYKSGKLETLEQARAHASRGIAGHQIPMGENDFAKISVGDVDFYFSFTAAPPTLKTRRLVERDPLFSKIFFSSMILTGIILFSLLKMDATQNVDAEQMPDRIATILYEPEKFIKPPTPKPEPKPEVKPEPKPEPIQKPELKPKPIQKLDLKPEPKPQLKPKQKLTLESDLKQKSTPKLDLKPQPQQKPQLKPAKPAPRAEAKEGEGTKAKGPEGSRGEKGKPKAAVQATAMNRPSPTSGTSGASGASQVSEEGNVDLLKGADGRIQNILGNSAAQLGGGSKGLSGFGNFSSQGNGGLALSGKGTGGGGTAETTLGGLGNKGSGMGRVGTGKGAVGDATGIVGANMRVTIRSDGPEETVVMGAIDRNAVAEAIYAHRDEFRLCYEREINAETPSLSGQISTRFVIGSSGRVTQAGIESSSLKNSNTERCVLTVLKRIDFPSPRGGGVVEVKFPFKFSAVGR